MLTGDPTNADPVCDMSPHHGAVLAVVATTQLPQDPKKLEALVFRGSKESASAEKLF